MDRAPLWLRRTRRALVPAGAATLAIAMLLVPTDADAQRRRRRHRETNSNTQVERPPQPTTTTTTATTTTTSATTNPSASTTAPSTASTTATTNLPAQSVQASPSASPRGRSRDEAPPPRVEPQPPPPPPPSTTARPAAIDFQIGPRLFGRSLWFTDDLFRRLRTYNVLGVPGAAAALEFYPGALISPGVASMFGLVASGEYNLVLSSTDAQGRSYATTSYAFHAGLRVRYVFAGRFDVGVNVGYAHQALTIERGNVVAPPEGIMSTTYQSIRAGASARLQIVPRLAILASASYLFVLGTGELGSTNFFPRLNAGGVDFGLGGAFGITNWLEVRLNLDWRRYFMAMNPMVGDPLIAGGAVDDYFAGAISIAFRH